MELPRRSWLVLLSIAILVSTSFAQQPMTVRKVKDFIQSAIQLHNSDKDVAAALGSMKLTEKFTLSDLGDLQSAGAGPKTLKALAAMVTQSAGLPAPQAPAAAPPPPRTLPEPSEAEKNELLEKTREWALDYLKTLPDFVCYEDTYRSTDPHHRTGEEDSWTLEDRVIEKLTFFDHKENYELAQHNDTPTTKKDAASLGGARSTGDWASLLGEIFEPSSHTDFHWTAWATVRGKLAWNYRYRIDRQHSQSEVAHGDNEKVVTGIAGDIFIEKDAGKVLRLTVVNDIPPDFPIQDVSETVDYEYQTIGPEQFLLPQKSVLTMREGQTASLNEIRWRNYRKYSADTTLTFGDGAADPKK